MGKRLRTLALVVAVCCVLAAPGNAWATAWQKTKAPASFRAYAKHAREHGMKAWFPYRLPAGYKLKSVTYGDMGDAGPYCDIVFKRGSARITFGQGTVVGADGEMPSRDGTCKWGGSKANVYKHNSLFGEIVWFGSASDYGGLAGNASLATLKSVAKQMRQI